MDFNWQDKVNDFLPSFNTFLWEMPPFSSAVWMVQVCWHSCIKYCKCWRKANIQSLKRRLKNTGWSHKGPWCAIPHASSSQRKLYSYFNICSHLTILRRKMQGLLATINPILSHRWSSWSAHPGFVSPLREPSTLSCGKLKKTGLWVCSAQANPAYIHDNVKLPVQHFWEESLTLACTGRKPGL